jgi:hypothetical protein
MAKRCCQALNAENIPAGTIYDNSIPRPAHLCQLAVHVSGLAEDRRAPWKSPFYKGDVKGYTRDQCPKSLDYLGRAIMIFIDQYFTREDADMTAEGIRKVAAALL